MGLNKSILSAPDFLGIRARKVPFSSLRVFLDPKKFLHSIVDIHPNNMLVLVKEQERESIKTRGFVSFKGKNSLKNLIIRRNRSEKHILILRNIGRDVASLDPDWLLVIEI